MVVRLTERSDDTANDVHVEADPLRANWLMTVRRRTPESSEMTFGDIPQTVFTFGIRRVADPGGIAKLRGQQMSPQDTFGPAIVTSIDHAAEDQSGLHDVTGVVRFAEIRNSVGSGAFHR